MMSIVAVEGWAQPGHVDTALASFPFKLSRTLNGAPNPTGSPVT